jgi:hypothetical protein
MRQSRPRLASVAPSVSPTDVDTFLDSLAIGNTPQDQVVIDAAVRLRRELSTLQLVAVALIGDFVAGRKLRT